MDTYKQPYLRKLIGCQQEDYVSYTLLYVPFTVEQRARMIKKKKKPVHKFTMDKFKPRMTDQAVLKLLDRYDECSFDQLPSWLRDTIRVRNLNIKRRPPTEYEQLQTIEDAREHRITNHELTIKDYINFYKGKRTLSCLT